MRQQASHLDRDNVTRGQAHNLLATLTRADAPLDASDTEECDGCHRPVSALMAMHHAGSVMCWTCYSRNL